MTEQTKMKSLEDVIQDMVRIDHNDPEIYRSYEILRHTILEKGQIYRELFASRLTGAPNYLVTETDTEFIITDLTTHLAYTHPRSVPYSVQRAQALRKLAAA